MGKLFFRYGNDKGFTIGTLLILGVALSALITAVLMQFNSRSRLSSKDKNSHLVTNLRSRLEMLFTHNELCRQNLRAGFFGANLNEALDLSRNGRVRIVQARYSPSNSLPVDPQAQIAASTVYQGLQIYRILFSPIGSSTNALFSSASALPGTHSYLVNLEIQFSASSAFGSPPLRIPFYFATDSAGVFTDCFASTFPHPDRFPGRTLEDFLCGEISGTNHFFDPGSKMCLASSAVP